MNIQILNPKDDPRWDERVLQYPGATLFHSSHWARVLSESYGYTPVYFTVMEKDMVRALLPMMEVKSLLTGKRGVSLPFTDFCDPLLADDVNFGELWCEVVDFSQKQGWKYIELRTNTFDVSRFSSNVFTSRSSGLPTQSSVLSPQSFLSFMGHTLILDKEEKDLLAGFRDSTRRNIRKAAGEGVEIRMHGSIEDLKEFVRLNSLTRREHGLPPQPERFFSKLHEHILSRGHGKVVLASHQGKTVAGAIFLHYGEKAHYKYGASDREFQHLRANNLIMWEAVKGYAWMGMRSLCLGRTETDHAGLLQFKAGWNPVEQPIRYYRYDMGKSSFVSGISKVRGFHNEVFKRMPVPVLNRVGAILYRHVG